MSDSVKKNMLCKNCLHKTCYTTGNPCKELEEYLSNNGLPDKLPYMRTVAEYGYRKPLKLKPLKNKAELRRQTAIYTLVQRGGLPKEDSYILAMFGLGFKVNKIKKMFNDTFNKNISTGFIYKTLQNYI